MGHFFDYSKYYNLLYRNKDYSQEVDYVYSLIQEFQPAAKELLDIGCGTGNHAKLFANKGLYIYGIDLSEQMLEIARKSLIPNANFSVGDIRSFRIGKKFDVITSLFHVMSYQTSNDAVASSFRTVREHMNEDGVFIFDCWYGPAVLTDLPGFRIKKMEDESMKVIRVSEPVIDFNRSIVEVNFEVNAYDKKSRELQVIYEKHPMRYFFINEVELFAEQCGLKVMQSYAWLTKDLPSQNSWYVTFICKKIK